MKCVFTLLLLVAVLVASSVATPLPQVEHGSLNGPSGRFERTRNQSVPPVDLSLPPIYLPESIPVHEAPQELIDSNSLIPNH